MSDNEFLARNFPLVVQAQGVAQAVSQLIGECNAQIAKNAELTAEVEKLKARIAELEKPAEPPPA